MDARAIGLVLMAFLAGCATVPDVTYTYYPSELHLNVSVIETVQCDKDKGTLYVVQTPTVTSAYSKVSKDPLTVRVRDVEGAFGWAADTDMAFNFYDDGRLKSVNQSTTGQGEAIAKSALSLAASAALLAGGAENDKATDSTACNLIASLVGENKPLSLTYGVPIDVPTDTETLLKPEQNVFPLEAMEGSAAADKTLKGVLPSLKANITVEKNQPQTVSANQETGGTVPLELRQVLTGVVEVKSDGASIGRYPIQLPTSQKLYLPIPKAALFGNQKFQVSLSEAGAIQSIDYAKTTGAAAALNVIGGATSAAGPVGEAASLKARADVIAQQQRLIACKADPENCK